jgi:short-subunit dehydrogenase
MSVLLTALPQDEERLRALADELAAGCGVRTEAVPIDLSERDAARRLQAAADERGFEPELLVNCAGLGAVGAFAELPLERQLQMVRVNIEALVELTGLYLPRMVARRSGAVLNVASTAAFAPMPYLAVYAASKAFAVSFSEALWAEGRRNGVRVVAVCPGPMAGTGFHTEAGDPSNLRGIRGPMARRYLTRESVVAEALRSLERDKPTMVQRTAGFGILGQLLTVAGSIAPRRVRLIAAERLSRWYFSQPKASQQSSSEA